ncbi:MAG: hypothetical protein ABFS09_12350 [Thermodesulfobacteriota bacterium]
MPTKAIRFSLSQEECRERRTISWLNNPPKKQLVDNYMPTYAGFREIRNAEIIIADKQILHYKNFFLDLQGVIFAHDEYQRMGTNKHSNHPDHHRLTPDGVDIITKSSGTPAYHINCHVYNFNACLAKHPFIPMTNVLIKRLDGAPGSTKNKGTKFFPFLALNREYIDGFSILFRGSRLKT